MPITKEAIEKGLTVSDIVEDVKHTPKSRLTKRTKAEVILEKLNDKSYRDIAKEKNIAFNTSLKVIKDNKELISQIESRQTELKESVRDKYLKLLDKKSKLLNENKSLSRSKATELSQVVKDLDTLIRLDKGEATSITHHLSEEDARIELERSLEVLHDNDLIKLKERVFRTE